MSQPSPRSLRLAEKLTILNDHGRVLLARIYRTKKVGLIFLLAFLLIFSLTGIFQYRESAGNFSRQKYGIIT